MLSQPSRGERGTFRHHRIISTENSSYAVSLLGKAPAAVMLAGLAASACLVKEGSSRNGVPSVLLAFDFTESVLRC